MGVTMALALATIVGILRGIDAQDAASCIVTSVGLVGGVGWVFLYPIWYIWLGRTLLLR